MKITIEVIDHGWLVSDGKRKRFHGVFDQMVKYIQGVLENADAEYQAQLVKENR